MLLNKDDLIMLKLHYRYRVLGVKNQKLFIQQVDHFSVKQQVSSLAYKLKLSSNMKIHSIILITNLESLLLNKDLYNCLYNDHSPLVEKNKNKNELDKN